MLLVSERLVPWQHLLVSIHTCFLLFPHTSTLHRRKTLMDLGIKWFHSMISNPDPERTWLQLVTPAGALAQVGAISEAWALLRDYEVLAHIRHAGTHTTCRHITCIRA